VIYTFPPYESSGKSSFAYWQDFLSDQDINEILNCSEWNNLGPAKIGSRENNGIVPKIRETEISWYKKDHSNEHIWEKLANCAVQVNRHFFRYDLSGFYEPAQLGYYHEHKKSHYDWHTDAGIANAITPRKLSMVLQLNDRSEFEGGDLQIKIENDTPQTLDIQKGRAWFFPSFVLHRVTPVTKGERKSLVLWITGPEFK
jgi:PKHD-type hydroxylase